MKCPKCHNEVLNQRVCPYCGGTVYLEDASLEMENSRFGARREIPAGHRADMTDALIYRIGKMETKINVILVLSVACFFLMILILLVMMAAM